MKGAAPVPAKRASVPTTLKTSTIGSSHHFSVLHQEEQELSGKGERLFLGGALEFVRRKHAGSSSTGRAGGKEVSSGRGEPRSASPGAAFSGAETTERDQISSHPQCSFLFHRPANGKENSIGGQQHKSPGDGGEKAQRADRIEIGLVEEIGKPERARRAAENADDDSSHDTSRLAPGTSERASRPASVPKPTQIKTTLTHCWAVGES